MAETIDHEARRAAAAANQKIDEHEKRCGDRWRAAHKTMENVEASVGKIHGRIDRIVWGLLIGVASVALLLATVLLQGGGARP